MLPPFDRCPKCGHAALPKDQRLPAACPACGVILAKLSGYGHPVPMRGGPLDVPETDVPETDRVRLTDRPDLHGPWHLGARALLWLALTLWGWRLMSLDHQTGEFGESFLHGLLLVFHEAGHVIFRLFGEWVSVLGGTLGQLIMPALIGATFLLKNRDGFGASVGLWFVGASLLDIAPYVFDAKEPRLMLLSGRTGEEGGHDWIYLLSSVGQLAHAEAWGGAVRVAGALVMLTAGLWGAWMLRLHAQDLRDRRS